MSAHRASVEWVRDGQDFAAGGYGRAHDWRFDGGAVVRASSAPSSVPVPLSDPAAVDPEEALVAALSSCHMLFFLALARRDGWVVDAYRDEAEGILGPDDRGRTAITRVTLRPRVDWSGPAPGDEAVADLHRRAHQACYIANSLRAEVAVATA